MVSIHRPPAHEARIELLKEKIILYYILFYFYILTREGIEPPTSDLAISALQLSYLVIMFAIFIWYFIFLKNGNCCMKIMLTGGGFEPPTFGLWAQHATSAPSRFNVR
jgi:hypothetical protein